MSKVTSPESPNSTVFGQESTPAPTGKKMRDAKGHFISALGHESTEIYQNVAKVWQDQCTPVETLIESLKADQATKVDDEVPEAYARLNDNLQFPEGETISKSALSIASTKFTALPSSMVDYLFENEDKADLAKYFNREMDTAQQRWINTVGKKGKNLHEGKEKKFLLRSRIGEDGSKTVRALLSERYGIYDNLPLLEMVLDALPSKDETLVSHAFNDGDKIHLNLLLPDSFKSIEGDSDYGTGISISNSEIGTDTAEVMPFLFRAICVNGCIWGRRDSAIVMKKKHIGEIDFDAMRNGITQLVALALAEGNNFLGQMLASKEIPIGKGNILTIIDFLRRENKMTLEMGKAWYEGFKKEPINSAFGIVNGLTRAAQEFSGDTRYDLECVASQILAPSLVADINAIGSKWNKIESRAIDNSQKSDKLIRQYEEAAVLIG